MIEARKLILPKKLLVGLSGVGIAMIIGMFYNAYQGYAVNLTWFYVAVIFVFIPFLAVLVDLIQNPIQDKLIWIIFLTLFSVLASFIYLVGRDKVLEKSGLFEEEINR